MATLHSTLHLVATHPSTLLAALVAWQLFSALVTAVFRRRTDEERQRFKDVAPTWLFGLVALCETLGVDLPRAIGMFDPLVRALLQLFGHRGVDGQPPKP